MILKWETWRLHKAGSVSERRPHHRIVERVLLHVAGDLCGRANLLLLCRRLLHHCRLHLFAGTGGTARLRTHEELLLFVCWPGCVLLLARVLRPAHRSLLVLRQLLGAHVRWRRPRQLLSIRRQCARHRAGHRVCGGGSRGRERLRLRRGGLASGLQVLLQHAHRHVQHRRQMLGLRGPLRTLCGRGIGGELHRGLLLPVRVRRIERRRRRGRQQGLRGRLRSRIRDGHRRERAAADWRETRR